MPTLSGNISSNASSLSGEVNVKSAKWGLISGTLSDQTDLQNALNAKVDKVEGKGLSTNDYDNTEKQKVADAYSLRHSHSNKELLDTYNQTNANLTDAVSKKHSHSNKALLDTYTQTEANLSDAVSKKHSHDNKALLDTYTQTESNLADAVSKKHTHDNKAVIDTIASTDITNWNSKSTVSVSASGTSTDEVHYITINGTEKKLAGGGVADYAELTNKPKINNVELLGNKTSSDLGLAVISVSNECLTITGGN